ncbi:DUF2383 domain-containing protein [Roseinatronobacter sp. NSM]|uniref:DUF2383 domain-containing protein n=1 Tax=Roseinatronobacter sp. NSM TaxID=3457785 RepID=UPI0040375E3E
MKAPEIKQMNPELDEAAPMPAPDGEALRLIAEVHTRVLDTIAGFEKIVEKAEPDFTQVAETFLYLHRKHERDLAAYLAKCGYAPDNDGSFFGTVNKALVEMRSWFEDVSDNIMDRIIHGEKHVIDAYENARSVGQTLDANAMLTRHIEDIDALMHKHTSP